MRRKRPAFAIVRHDEFLGPEIEVDRRVTVVAVIEDEPFARSEVDRLNALERGSAQVWYVLHPTRIVEAG